MSRKSRRADAKVVKRVVQKDNQKEKAKKKNLDRSKKTTNNNKSNLYRYSNELRNQLLGISFHSTI